MITAILDHFKVVASENTDLRQFKLECQELREQLNEYKGLT